MQTTTTAMIPTVWCRRCTRRRTGPARGGWSLRTGVLEAYPDARCLIGPCWVRSGRSTTDNSGQEWYQRFSETVGPSTYGPLTSCGDERRRGGRVSPPGCRVLFGLLPSSRWVTGDGPRPLAELGAVAGRWEEGRSRRPCHPWARRSGHEGYPADSHGHFQEAVGPGAETRRRRFAIPGPTVPGGAAVEFPARSWRSDGMAWVCPHGSRTRARWSRARR